MIVNMYLFGRLRVDFGMLSKLYLCVIAMSVVSAFGFLSISHNTDIWSISVEFYSASLVNIFCSSKMSIIVESFFYSSSLFIIVL